MDASKSTLVLGGARSGKSRYAEGQVMAWPAPWTYVATAQAFDDEMRERIAVHRARREAGWVTVDAPLDLVGALHGGSGREPGPMLVDCLTLWLTNVMLAERDVAAETEAVVAAVAGRAAPTVLVSNEVGFGIVPENALARRFRDAAGVLHQRLAAEAGRVVLMVAGIPVVVK